MLLGPRGCSLEPRASLGWPQQGSQPPPNQRTLDGVACAEKWADSAHRRNSA